MLVPSCPIFLQTKKNNLALRARWGRLARLLVRAILAALLLWVGVTIPIPFTPAFFFIAVQIPLIVFLAIIYFGKLLYDTFFYDHYKP